MYILYVIINIYYNCFNNEIPCTLVCSKYNEELGSAVSYLLDTLDMSAEEDKKGKSRKKSESKKSGGALEAQRLETPGVATRYLIKAFGPFILHKGEVSKKVWNFPHFIGGS